ncbi:MAG TPA: hypothetical protein ENJ95_11280, partial [Bacteroidetes bacterium]|nr:hypothetical protein [Bacteroidota bacterium]
MKNQLIIHFSNIKEKILTRSKSYSLPIFILGFFFSNLAPLNSQCIHPADLTNNTLEVCFGEKITFCPEDGADICYKWLPEETFLLGESTFPNPTTFPIIEDIEIQLIKTDGNGNIIENTVINVIVNDFDLDLTEIYEICAGESITLDVNPSGGSGNYTYFWSTGESSPSITVTPTESILYNVEIQDVESGCSLIVSHLVTVNPSPEIWIDPSHTSICLSSLPGRPQDSNEVGNKPADCENHSVGLSVSSNDDIIGYSFEWSTGETSPTISVEEIGEYTVTITNGSCISTASFELESCVEVTV